MSLFIDDGYTERGSLAPVPGLHTGLEFEFRPMILADRSAYVRQSQGKKGDELNALAAKWLSEKIVSWNAGREVKQADLLKLKPSVFNRLFAIVFGDEAHDNKEESDEKN